MVWAFVLRFLNSADSIIFDTGMLPVSNEYQEIQKAKSDSQKDGSFSLISLSVSRGRHVCFSH